MITAPNEFPRGMESKTPVLDRISSPAEVRTLSNAGLTALAADIRHELLEIVPRNGGHLGASLGAIELAIALHRVFESPYDKIVWDVGHQAYAHKLLTGRRDRFDTIRQEGGLSGFLSRGESEHDAFGAGPCVDIHLRGTRHGCRVFPQPEP